MRISKSDFVHLHVHSDNSTLDGAATIEELVRKAKSCGHVAMGLTDHGVVTGILDFYKEAQKTHEIGSKKVGPIKPILGCEVYLFDGDLNARGPDVRSNSYRHLTLLAQNLQGWKNISKLSSLGYLEGFYYRPRINWEMLEKYSEGVIALSGCLKGPLSVPIVQGRMEDAFKITGRLHDIYKKNLFLEIQPTPIESQYKVNDACMRFSTRTGIPLVVTGDVHYCEKQDFNIQNVKICIAMKTTMKENRVAHEGIYFRETEEMYKYFNHIPEAMTNTRRIADMIDFRLPIVGDGGQYHLPKFECPDNLNEVDYFKKVAREGINTRYNIITKEIEDRVEREIKVIEESGFASYFLIVADFIQWAKNNDIPVGPGRGCLTDKSYVFTDSGYKSIKNVIPFKDKTINEFGQISEVVNKFEYNIDEEIVKIKSYYDFFSNSEFTLDHKILIKKGEEKDVYKQTLHPSDKENMWIPAREVSVGDYVCIPKLKFFRDTKPEAVNMTKYLHSNCEIVESTVIERTPINHPYKDSVREVSKKSGISRNCLKDIVSKSPTTLKSSKEKLLKFLKERTSFQNVEDWISYTLENRFKRSYLPLHLEKDENYAKFVGLWIGDGNYHRSASIVINLCSDDVEAMSFLEHYLTRTLKVRYTKGSPKGKEKLVVYAINSKVLANHFRDIFGEVHSDTKFVPQDFYWYRELAEGVFEGLIWSDGSTSDRRVAYDTVSERLMYDIRRLGYALDTPSSVSKREQKEKGWKDSYKIRFSRSKFIERKYGFKYGRHNFSFEDENFIYCAVRSVEKKHFKGKVYDLSIQGASPSFLTGGYIVHNSAAGSIVAYSMGITDCEPLKNGLLFERFLNPDRISMPDIDIDFDDTQRERVIDYVREKYGDESVCQIITFGTMATKSVIKSVAKVFDLPFQDINKITRSIGRNPQTGKDHTIKSWRKTEEAQKVLKEMPQMEQVLDIAEKLEGKKRDYGKHAAAVVIGDTDLKERIPLTKVGQKGNKVVTTQFPMAQVEDVGLLKMDFLGLRTLSVIQHAEKLISKKLGRKFVTKDEVDFDDPNIYEYISTGHTKGLFQIESPGFRTLLKNMKPTGFDDIVASVAIYRPGPLGVGMDKTYCLRKNGEEEIEYTHPCLEPYLKKTMGGIIYQEQIMQIAAECAGFTMAQADVLRKGVGKKKADVIAKMKPKFIKGMNEVSNVPVETAEEIWAQIEFFAEYGFNLCVAKNTLIYNAISGSRHKIGDLVENLPEGDFYTFAKDKSGKIVKRKVLDFKYSEDQQTYKVTTDLGREITLTAKHPLFTISGWKKLQDLNIGDYIAVPRTIPVNTDKVWPDHEIDMLAGLISEGNTCHPSCMYIYNKNPEYLKHFENLTGKFPNTKSRTSLYEGKKASEICYSSIKKHRRNQYTYGPYQRIRSGVFLWAEKLGILGKTATEKSIPSEVFLLSNSCLARFIGVLWAGDGYIFKKDESKKFNSVYFATSSINLAKDVQNILIRFGIVAKIDKAHFKYRETIKVGHQVRILGKESYENFLEHIAPYCITREEDVRNLTNFIESAEFRCSKDNVPQELHRLDLPFSTQSRNIVKDYAERIHNKALLKHATSDIYWDEIVNIEKLGVEPTYDLTIDGDHNFIANDICVHNSHSAAYAMITVYTAYLKTYHPVEFMAALLSSFCTKRDKMLYYIEECRRMGIEIEAPDIQRSQDVFSVHDEKIVYGFKALEGLGDKAVETIIETRDRIGSFFSMFHFCENIEGKLTQSNLETLIKAGAFRSFGFVSQLLQCSQEALAGKKNAKKNKKQKGLFDAFVSNDEFEKLDKSRLPDVSEFDEETLQNMEKETLGIYLSGHPLDKYGHLFDEFNTHTTIDLNSLEDETKFCIGGIIKTLEERQDRKNQTWARITLEDRLDSTQFFCWASYYNIFKDYLFEGNKIFIKGTYRINDRGSTYMVNEISSFEDMQKNFDLIAKTYHSKDNEAKKFDAFLEDTEDEEEITPPKRKIEQYTEDKTEDKTEGSDADEVSIKPETSIEPERNCYFEKMKQKEESLLINREEEFQKEEPQEEPMTTETKEEKPQETFGFNTIKKQLNNLKAEHEKPQKKYLINLIFPLAISEDKIDKIQELFSDKKGPDIVRYKFEGQNEVYQLDHKIFLDDDLEDRLIEILGKDNVKVYNN